MKRVMIAMRSTMKRGLALGPMIGVMDVGNAAGVGCAAFPLKQCSPDAVAAGTTCLDRYEASVWRVPNPTTTNATLVKRIQLGKATLRGGAFAFGSFFFGEIADPLSVVDAPPSLANHFIGFRCAR
jgi:hypothetical protein